LLESGIKAKKYETLIVQIWDLLPNFCRNEINLDKNFALLIPHLEAMVNKNTWGLRYVAL